MSEQASLADEAINQSFGYKQELRRALKLFSLYAVAFSIISITTGLFANYGFGLAHLGAAMIWLWPVAAVGQMLIALGKICVAGALLALVCWAANYLWLDAWADMRFFQKLGILLATIAFAGVAFFGAAFLLRISEVQDIIDVFRRRLR